MNDNKFEKPLNQWIEEDVPVRKNRFIPDANDPTRGRITTVVEMQKQKTMYIDAPKQHYRCKDGEHVFYVKDKHKWIFSCQKCTYSRKVYPTTYKFVDGKLIHRETGRVV
jgi:hypothetical protein